MTMQITQITAIISVVIALTSIIISTWRNAKTENTANVGQMTEISIKLEGIKDNTLEIKNEIKAVKNDIEGIKERLVIVEQSTKSAHKRIDSIKNEKTTD